MDQATMDAIFDQMRDERDRWTERARASIREARLELNAIEESLDNATSDLPYLRVERVDGINAQAVFNAFGSIERLAQMEAYVKRQSGVEHDYDCDVKRYGGVCNCGAQQVDEPLDGHDSWARANGQ